MTIPNKQEQPQPTSPVALCTTASRPATPRWSGLSLIALLALTCITACADVGEQADDGLEQAESESGGAQESIGKIEQAVQNGFAVANDDYSGMLRLWVFHQGSNEWRHICTGVLFRNNVVLTARHCVVPSASSLTAGFPNTSANVAPIVVSTNNVVFVANGVGAPILPPDGRDVAAFRINATLPVRTGGQIVWNGFAHRLGSLSPSQYVIAYGYGMTTPNQTSNVCNYRSSLDGRRLPGCPTHMMALTAGAGLSFLSTQEVAAKGTTTLGGDSGGMTALAVNVGLPDMPLVGINSVSNLCIPLDSSNCGAGAARVDNLGGWLNTIW